MPSGYNCDNSVGVDVTLRILGGNGKLEKTVTKKGDMFLDNFLRLVFELALGTVGSVSAKDVLGVTANFTRNSALSSTRVNRIHIGGGDTAPTRADYVLADFIGSINTVNFIENAQGFLLSGTYYFADQTDIKEVGYVSQFTDEDSNDVFVMLTRDTPTPITVPAGKTLEVTLQFNY